MHRGADRFLFSCVAGREPELARAIGAECAAGWLSVQEASLVIGDLARQAVCATAGGVA